MDRDRDDVAVNDILSQLSQDETVLEEVRKIALRGLKAQGTSGDNQRERVASQEVDRSNNGDTSERPSSNNKTLVRTPRREKIVQKSTATESDDDLAFTVSKESDTYRNIFSTVQWYRDSFLIGSTFADERSAERKAIYSGHSEKMQSSGENEHIIGNGIVNQSIIPKSDPSTAMG